VYWLADSFERRAMSFNARTRRHRLDERNSLQNGDT